MAKYPALTFKSTRVEKLGNARYKVTGDLTLRGVTKQVVLDVEGLETVVKDPRGNVKRGAVAATKLNRKDFGLAWNRVVEAGGLVYLPGTNVLETRFDTGQGVLRLVDLMPVASEEEKARRSLPEHELLRVARRESVEVELAHLSFGGILGLFYAVD